MIELLLFVSALTLAGGLAVLLGEDVQAPAVPIAVVTTAETLIATSVPLTMPTPNGKAVIRGSMLLTVGASTTAVTLTIYAGAALAGRVVGQQIAQGGNFTAGKSALFQVEGVDMLNNVTGVQYCMSVLQTGASGNGSVVNAIIDTKLLSG